MTNKKPTDRYGYLPAFILGMVLMVIVYILFESTTKRTRSGSADSVDTETGRTYTGGTYTSIVRTGKDEEAPLSAFLGVEILSVDSVIAKQLGLPSRNGVLINSVVPNSPAQKAGLERGDVIVALNNRTIKDVDRFKEVMAKLNPAESVRIVYIRNSKKDLTYTELAEAPAIQKTAQSPGPSDSGWGVSLSPISSTLRESLSIPPDINGTVILSVVPRGAADRAGLMPGDVIRGIDKTPISDMDDFFRAILSDKDDTALLDVYSRGRMRYVPMDSAGIKVADQAQAQTTLRQRIFSIFTGGAPFSSDAENVILTEHINEEGDFEKPVCKRLEESGERYNVKEEADGY